MKDKLYKWLPRIFGCHCIDERSFHFHGKKVPICSRCTGEMVGMLLGIILYFFYRLNIKLAIFFMIPMVIDGGIQMLTKYESNNVKRFITGILFGYGLSTIWLITTIYAIKLGYECGLKYKIN